MSSVKPFSKSYVMLEQLPSANDITYPTFAPLLLAILHFFCGLFSIALGIGAICTHSSGYFIGYGIWCGFIFLLSGCFTMITCCRPCAHTCMILTSLVFGVIAACAAIVQFSLGVVAAANDNGNLQVGRLAAYNPDIPRYDIFYIRQNDNNLCTGSGFTWVSSWGAVDILLLIVAFVELVVAMVTAVLGCKSMCCGQVTLIHQDSSEPSVQPVNAAAGVHDAGFYNVGYDTNEPPLYPRGNNGTRH